MQDEEMDDIIRDAANQHHPAYDDKAWSKMEGLLDKHLPQKKDNRRIILFFLLFLLLGGGVFYAFFNAHKNNTINVVAVSQDNARSNNTAVSTLAQNNQVLTNKETINGRVAENKTAVEQTTISATNKNNKEEAVINNTTNTDATDITASHSKFTHKTKSKFRTKVTNGIAAEENTDEAGQKQTEPSNDMVSSTDNQTDKASRTEGISTITKDSVTNVSISKINDTINKAAIASAKKPSVDKKDDHTFKNNFAFTATAGPGLSYVGLDYLGKTTFTYGAGVAYSISKKFTIRTGFYVSSKIYSANPSDYHPPKTFWQYYPDLKKIDANCKVYEIPVTLTYNFHQVKKHNWFVAIGLASYIMKDENYGYYSTDVNGQTQYRNADISNQNKNVFSILTLSGGYQYHINNRFSIMAEPFIELPLNGIGFGKINLNSSGLLFTLAIKPFAAKK